MKRLFWVSLTALAVSFCALTGAAQAQATRTWISGVGDDANPCSRTAPCKTFAGAISKTSDCGEIDALDPGGFGGVTITKGITLDGGGGQVASILVGGTPGITINNSSATCHSDIIRNMRIVGLAPMGGAGTIGINIVTSSAPSAVILEHDAIFQFSQQCVYVNATQPQFVTILDSQFDLCTLGGLSVTSTVAADTVSIARSIFTTNGVGITVGPNSHVNLESSQVVTNTTGGVLANASTAKIDINESSVSNNIGYGIQATSGAIVNLSNTTVVYNLGQGLMGTGATLLTWSNNWVYGNNPDGTRTGTTTPM
jgi:hypothetical protein